MPTNSISLWFAVTQNTLSSLSMVLGNTDMIFADALAALSLMVFAGVRAYVRARRNRKHVCNDHDLEHEGAVKLEQIMVQVRLQHGDYNWLRSVHPEISLPPEDNHVSSPTTVSCSESSPFQGPYTAIDTPSGSMSATISDEGYCDDVGFLPSDSTTVNLLVVSNRDLNKNNPTTMMYGAAEASEDASYQQDSTKTIDCANSDNLRHSKSIGFRIFLQDHVRVNQPNSTQITNIADKKEFNHDELYFGLSTEQMAQNKSGKLEWGFCNYKQENRDGWFL
uniref:Uncharacterized protein n=1 Tax=Spongospora subterranea TaxID=70186 RepID=A0A0H5RBU5_9EUKA|eukprot:CRZ11503.1 hypothetical protein [Spongospora subterranea]